MTKSKINIKSNVTLFSAGRVLILFLFTISFGTVTYGQESSSVTPNTATHSPYVAESMFGMSVHYVLPASRAPKPARSISVFGQLNGHRLFVTADVFDLEHKYRSMVYPSAGYRYQFPSEGKWNCRAGITYMHYRWTNGSTQPANYNLPDSSDFMIVTHRFKVHNFSFDMEISRKYFNGRLEIFLSMGPALAFIHEGMRDERQQKLGVRIDTGINLNLIR